MRPLPVRLFSLVQVKAFAANVKPAGLWGSGDSPALHAFFVSAAVPRLFHKKNLTSIYLLFYRAKYFALPPTNKCVAAPVASYHCEFSSVEAAHLDIHTGGGKVHGRTTEGLGVCMEVVKHNGVENDRGMESSGRAVK